MIKWHFLINRESAMKSFWIRLSLILTLGFFTQVSAEPAQSPRVLMETSEGSMIIELYPDKAPKTVENFLNYVNQGFYDGTIFHRVIANFMIQGGGMDESLRRKPTQPPIQNEADNGLQNRIGSIAMARTNDPHSATSQFFINVANNGFLDFREKTDRAYGYTVFGRVVEGMRTVNQIRSVPTGSQGGHQDVPLKPVIIQRVRIIQ
jgi:cyclophilin family peptidyl-prolyl cis-trans isomerase